MATTRARRAFAARVKKNRAVHRTQGYRVKGFSSVVGLTYPTKGFTPLTNPRKQWRQAYGRLRKAAGADKPKKGRR